MISLDSIKFSIPLSQVELNSDNQFKSEKHGIEVVNEHGEVYTKKELTKYGKIEHGLNSITIDKLQDEVIFECSAKILKENYYDGFTLNTIEQLHHEITKHGIANFTLDDLLQATPYTLDNTTNIILQDINKSVQATVLHGKMNDKYAIQTFNRKGNYGFVATRDVKTYKERSTGYSKLIEIKNKNDKFAKDYPDAIKRFTPETLRFETNFANFDHVRKMFRVSTMNIGSILNSNENVNLKMFERIIETSKQLSLFNDEYDNLSFPELIKQVGYKEFFRQLNNDLTEAKKFIKVKYERYQHSYYYRLLKEQYAKMTKDQRDIQNKWIDDITNKLKTA